MGCRQRIYFTDSRKAEIWDRRQRGESMRSIGRRFDHKSSSIFPLLSRTGGIRPLAHTRSRPALTHCDREEISGVLGAQLYFRAIARRLRRAPWTISREVERNGGRAGYRAARSDQAARDRAIPGHREGDSIAGSRNSYIAMLVERQFRYVLLAKVPDKNTDGVVAALVRQVQHLPRELARIAHPGPGQGTCRPKRLTLATDLEVCFRDPHSPWPHSPRQRGTNENTNRLLRQYFPKGTGLSMHSRTKPDAVARELNERRRKTLNDHSPDEKFAECVAAIS